MIFFAQQHHPRAIASNLGNWLYKACYNKPIFKALLYRCLYRPLENLDAIALNIISLKQFPVNKSILKRGKL